MQLRNLIRWINKNYPEVGIFVRGKRRNKVVIKRPQTEGDISIDFSWNQTSHGCIVSNTDGSKICKKYKKIIVIFDHAYNNSLNIWTLLHELGHHTSRQYKNNTLQNEINAWEHAIMFGRRLGLEVTKESNDYMKECLYSYVDVIPPRKEHVKHMKRLNLFKNTSMSITRKDKYTTPFYAKRVFKKKLLKGLQ